MKDRTKRAISEAFKALLSQKPIDKITIKEITDLCQVNRQTFYYHFQDIYDLMDWIIHEDWADFLQRGEVAKDPEGLQWGQDIEAMQTYLWENKVLLYHAYNPVNRIQYERFIKRSLFPAMRDRLQMSPEAAGVPEEKLDFIANAYIHIVTSLFTGWLESGLQNDFIENLDSYQKMVLVSIEPVLTAFQNP